MAKRHKIIIIARFKRALPLPAYHTAGAAAFDLYAREATTVKAGGLTSIPANIIVQTPPGYALVVSARSSLAKRGLMLANGIGVIDEDYGGPADEVRIAVYNFTKKKVRVAAGERLAQGMFLRVTRARWRESTRVRARSRGGFGSTGRSVH